MNKKQRAVFPGSFDPMTRGHLDIVERCIRIFDELVVGVVINVQKSTLFSLEEREELMREEFTRFKGQVKVASFDGLLVDFAKAQGAQVIIRGLRAISDYDYEAQMATMNKHLYEEAETFFMIAREPYTYVSSSLVRQVAQLGGDVSRLVSPVIEKALKSKWKGK